MTRTEQARRLEGPRLNLYQLARVTDATWPPPPQYPLPDDVPQVPASPATVKQRKSRRKTMEAKNEAILRALDRTPPQVTAEEYFRQAAACIGMTTNGIRSAATRLGRKARVGVAA